MGVGEEMGVRGGGLGVGWWWTGGWGGEGYNEKPTLQTAVTHCIGDTRHQDGQDKETCPEVNPKATRARD